MFPPGSLIQNLWPSRRITAHIDDVIILTYNSSTMLEAVIRFIVHDVNSIQVFIGKDFSALFKVAAQKPTKRNSEKSREIQTNNTIIR